MALKDVARALKTVGVHDLTGLSICIFLWVISGFISTEISDLRVTRYFWPFMGCIITIGLFVWALVEKDKNAKTPLCSYSQLIEELKFRRSYRLKIVSSLMELERAHMITQELFGERHPGFALVNRIYGDFTRPMTVMLYQLTDENRVPIKERILRHKKKAQILDYAFGFASAWPLTDYAGEEMTAGRLDEEGLRPEHFTSHAADAHYIYIPAIANLQAKSTAGLSRKTIVSGFSTTLLEIGLLDLLIKHFFVDNKKRTIIIDYWKNPRTSEKNGKNEMHKFDALFESAVREEDNESCTDEQVASFPVNATELIHMREYLLRWYGGIQDSDSLKSGLTFESSDEIDAPLGYKDRA